MYLTAIVVALVLCLVAYIVVLVISSCYAIKDDNNFTKERCKKTEHDSTDIVIDILLVLFLFGLLFFGLFMAVVYYLQEAKLLCW